LVGLIYTQNFGPLAFAVKVRVEILRDLGPCMSPFAAFLLLQGLETLSLRAERHSQNAMALAQCVPVSSRLHSISRLNMLAPLSRFLQQHEKVAWVSYLGLKDHSSYTLATQLLRKDVYGGVLSFGVKGDAAVGSKVVDSLKLASNLANVGKQPSIDFVLFDYYV
jgi:O-acetylhomoserine/O-acetylserine sulfhydrylase